MLIVSADEAVVDTTVCNYKCNVCGAPFRQKDGLLKHKKIRDGAVARVYVYR